MKEKLRAIDLFCGAGGATKGLQLAGFNVVGVDLSPQPRYCGEKFIQADAMKFEICSFIGGSADYHPEICDRCGEDYLDIRHTQFIWASPPCQAHSRLNGINAKQYDDFIGPIRSRLEKIGIPFVIENVVGAPLFNARMLCGSMFGLGIWRHRLFEPHGFSFESPMCRHSEFPSPLDVTGTGGPCPTRKTGGGGLHRKPKNMAQANRAMGIDWMIRRELTQSIPPAYAKYIGAAVYSIAASKA